MIKEIQRDQQGFIQLCDCGGEHLILFSDLSRSVSNRRIITLPVCSHCNCRIETLYLNGGNQPHDLLVAQIFAEVGG